MPTAGLHSRAEDRFAHEPACRGRALTDMQVDEIR